MKKLKVMSLLLALALLVCPLASCANGDGEDEETDGKSTNAPGTEGETKSPADAMLESLDIDWNGETFTILGVDVFKSEVDAVNGMVDPNGGSAQVINDAVYERNNRLEDMCKMELEVIIKDPYSASEQCKTEAQTGTGDFYIVNQRIFETVPLSVNNYMYDFIKLGVDLEQPWWDAGTADFSLGGNIFFMTGDANTGDDDVTYVLIFNKEMQRQYAETVPDPYTTVKNGDWTLDYFNKVIQGVSSDSNGDGKMDANDTYGFVTTWEYGNTLFIGSGLRYIINSRDTDSPVLYLSDSNQMNKAMTVLGLAQTIYHANNATFMSPPGQEFLGNSAFMSGRGLFFGDCALYLNAFNREMTGDYGVLTVPKYDKAQENYKTWTHESGSCLCVTSAVKEDMVDLVADTLQAYAAMSSLTLKPAYYDVMLTSRNVRDAESAEMLDLLFNNRVFDMAMYFSEELGFYSLFKTAVNDNRDTFSSGYSAASKRFDRNIERILKKLQ